MARINFFVLFLILTLGLNSLAQNITNVRISQDGTDVLIIYDLEGNPRPFNLNLFYTIDDGKSWQGPLKKVTGEVTLQLPGKNKKVKWDAIAENEEIEGTIQFKIDAEPVTPYDPIPDKLTINATDTPNFSADYNKYKKNKIIWLSSAIASGALGTVSIIAANSYYKQYQTVTDEAYDLHQKIAFYDIVAPIAFGISGFCAVEFFINYQKQGKVKKQMIGFYPQPLNNGAEIGIVYKF